MAVGIEHDLVLAGLQHADRDVVAPAVDPRRAAEVMTNGPLDVDAIPTTLDLRIARRAEVVPPLAYLQHDIRPIGRIRRLEEKGAERGEREEENEENRCVSHRVCM